MKGYPSREAYLAYPGNQPSHWEGFEKGLAFAGVKVECVDCGYVIRTTRKWLDVGNPSCPEGDEMFEVVK